MVCEAAGHLQRLNRTLRHFQYESLLLHGRMRTTSSLRISLMTSPWMLAAGGLYCTLISTLRSFSALPAFMIQGTPAHLSTPMRCH